MTSLVLGVAGAVVGNMLAPGIGGSIGFLVGSLLGNLIDPPKIEGPRRTDLKLQRSEYGTMFPFVWGTGRIAGNVIDQTDLVEHKETSGGKGGPEVTTYTYSASFLVALAAAKRYDERAIRAVLRIWADGRLIWDDESGEDMPCTVYLGTEDQEPDPTFEAINGVGNQPAYRGLAYAVFDDMMLTDYGDRIPALEFEVCTDFGAFPYRISNFDVTDGIPGDRSVEYANGVITVGVYRTASLPNGHYYEWQYDLQGNLVAGSAYDAELDLSGFPTVAVQGLAAATDGTTWWYKQNSITTITANPFGPAVLSNGCGAAQAIVYHRAGYIYATGSGTISGDIGVVRYPATGGVISTETGTYDAFIVTSNIGAGDFLSNWIVGTTNVPDRVYVYCSKIPKTLYEYDLGLTTVQRQWDFTAAHAVEPVVNGAGFTVYRSPLTGALIFACDRGTAGNKNAGAFTLGDDLSVTYEGQVDAIDLYTSTTTELGNTGYALVFDGVIRLDPPPASAVLSTIVADLSSMTSLSGEGSPETDCYDVSELTDEVRWYALATQSTVRNALDPLRRGFFFDAVESDDMVKFRKRGATDSVVTIDDDDLIAREYGSDGGDPLITTRKREQGMPRTVTLKYIDVNMDYQTGAQNSPRLVTLSDSDVTLDLPIGFTADEALQKCWSLQVAEWIERESFEWTTTRKYAWVEPCDVVTVRGRVVRVTNRQESPKGVITWTGVLHRPSIYTQAQTAGESVGFTEQTAAAAPVPTQLKLLDTPVLSQQDSPFGFYAAMGPSRDGPWPGASLYRSIDGGATYTAIASTAVPAVIGSTTSTDELGSPSFGSPSVGGALAAYAGGDVVDESSICVVLTDDDAELVSVSSTGLTNGMNLCAIRRGAAGSPSGSAWELCQFRDAVLVATKTYVLTGFLRGRKGTQTDGHEVGDDFVLLPVTNVDSTLQDARKSYLYKAVTFGLTVANTPAQTFTNNGEGSSEYYETEAGQLPIISNPQTGTTYTLQSSDNLRLLTFNNGSATTVTLPTTLSAGFSCFIENIGAGTVTLNAGSATIDEYVSTLDLDTDQGLLIAWDGDEWYTMRGIGSAGSSGGAPTTAQYLLREAHASLPNAHVVQAGVGITLEETGGSPGSALVIHASNTNAPFYVAGPASGLSAARTLVAGSGITLTDGGGSPPTTTTIATSTPKVLQFACSNETSELIAGTAKVTLRAPYAMTLTAVRASINSYSAGSPGGGGITVDINVNGSSILSTKLTIDAGEKTSTTAATAAVISSASIADDDEISVDIDSVGNGCTGLKVTLIGN